MRYGLGQTSTPPVVPSSIGSEVSGFLSDFFNPIPFPAGMNCPAGTVPTHGVFGDACSNPVIAAAFNYGPYVVVGLLAWWLLGGKR